MTTASSHPAPERSAFALTRWTLVARSQGDAPEARAALSELCATYYAPVVTFLTRSGRGEDAARECAHEFFEYILARGTLGKAERERGKFRSYLLGSLKHFMARAHENATRQKRGGGAAPISLDALGHGAESALELADFQTLPPDAFFDRQWALVILHRSLAVLEREFIAEGKGGHFTRLRPWLIGDAGHGDQAATARDLSMTEGALKATIHRLRRRFRTAVREEVSQTLTEPLRVEEEMRVLFAALGG